MKYEEIKGYFKKHDLVEISTKYSMFSYKYLVISISKDIIRVMQILEDEGVTAAGPIIAMPYSILSKIDKMASHSILFYLNINNSHIKNAIVSKNNNRRSNAKI